MTRVALVLSLLLLAGCKENAPKPTAAATAAKANEPPAGLAPGGNTNYQAGAGALQNTRQAARRAVAQSDMSQLGLIMSDMAERTGKMPTAAEVQAELRTTPNLLKLLQDGTVVLTGTPARSGLWAYEAEADTKGGIGLVGGTARRCEADEIKTLLRGG